jgi:hypothetical protein
VLVVTKKLQNNLCAMMDTSVTSITATCQQRIAAKPYVPATTYGRRKRGASGVPNKLFIAFV